MVAACTDRTASAPCAPGSHTVASQSLPLNDIGDHATSNNPSAGAAAADNCPAETGRIASERADNTGSPEPSANSTETDPAPDGAIRTRARDAPAACSDTPCQENGNTVWPCSPATPIACSAASNNTGWIPKPPSCAPASSGSATSAKISSPRRHIARSPRKARPYS